MEFEEPREGRRAFGARTPEELRDVRYGSFRTSRTVRVMSASPPIADCPFLVRMLKNEWQAQSGQDAKT